MLYKFSIGQKIKIQMENPWVGEYEVVGVITGIGNVFLNGVPTYNIKINNEDVLNEISELRLEAV